MFVFSMYFFTRRGSWARICISTTTQTVPIIREVRVRVGTRGGIRYSAPDRASRAGAQVFA